MSTEDAEKILSDATAKLTSEVYYALGQLHLAINGIDKIDMHGKRNVGVYRLRTTSAELHRIAGRVEALTEELRMILKDGTE